MLSEKLKNTNQLSKYKWAGFDFELGYLTEHCTHCTLYTLRESIWYKLLPMDGAPWIHDILAILDHFVIWARSETCQENIVLIFLAHNVKYKGK